MELNQDQIEQIRAFVKQKGIEFYDLQEELVDHLASSAEERMTENPDLTPDEAIRITHKEFGIFGFDDVLVERQKSLGNYYYRRLWVHFLHFWKPPQIFMTLLSGIGARHIVFRYDVPVGPSRVGSECCSFIGSFWSSVIAVNAKECPNYFLMESHVVCRSPYSLYRSTCSMCSTYSMKP